MNFDLPHALAAFVLVIWFAVSIIMLHGKLDTVEKKLDDLIAQSKQEPK